MFLQGKCIFPSLKISMNLKHFYIHLSSSSLPSIVHLVYSFRWAAIVLNKNEKLKIFKKFTNCTNSIVVNHVRRAGALVIDTL